MGGKNKPPPKPPKIAPSPSQNTKRKVSSSSTSFPNPLPNNVSTISYAEKLRRAHTASRMGVTFAPLLVKYPSILFGIHLILPLCILVLTNFQIFFPHVTEQFFPSLHSLPKPLENSTIQHWTKFQGVYARNRIEAWELGEIEGQLKSLLAYYSVHNEIITTNYGTDVDTEHAPGEEEWSKYQRTLINRTYTLLGSIQATDYSNNVTVSSFTVLPSFSSNSRTTMTTDNSRQRSKELNYLLQQLTSVKDTTFQLQNEEGQASYLGRVFSLVNGLWLIGILGILISIGPLVSTFLSILTTIFLYLWYYLLSHLWRPIIYLYGLLWFLHSQNADISIDIRIYVNIFFILAVWSGYVYTLYQLAEIFDIQSENPFVSLLYGCLLVFPIAHATGSHLLGFLTIGILFQTLGFGMAAFGRGYAIGFLSEKSLRLNTIVAAMLFVSYTVLRVGIMRNYWSGKTVLPLLAPFLTGIQVLGCTVMFLGLLILSSPWYDNLWYRSLILNVISLLGTIVIGNLVPGMIATANTAYVFLYLVGLDLLSYTGYRAGNSLWLGIFFLSVGIFWGALKAHQSPELLLGLYGSS